MGVDKGLTCDVAGAPAGCVHATVNLDPARGHPLPWLFHSYQLRKHDRP
jgi:hypothetical protein